MKIARREGDGLESLLRRFNRQVVKDGILIECKIRQAHESTREKRLRKQRAALARQNRNRGRNRA